MADYATEGQQTRAYAAYYGLWIGLIWTVSFTLAVYGLRHPFASSLAPLVGLASFPIAATLLKGFRDHIAGKLPLRRSWHMSWMMMLGAALITTFAQYIYFAYIDGGHFVMAYSEIIAQPETHDIIAQMLPDQDVDALANEALTTFAATPPSQIALQFLFWNTLLATVSALPIALTAKSRGI